MAAAVLEQGAAGGGGGGGSGGGLDLLILTNGMAAEDLTLTVEMLKQDSKKVGTHKRRQLYWDAYSQIISRCGSMEGAVFSMFKYKAGSSEGDDGTLEVVELTKRQRGLVGGGCEILGKKHQHAAYEGKNWVVAFSEDAAQVAWDDLMGAEPCICIGGDGIYVATRYKRVMCRGLNGAVKTMKDLEKIMEDLPAQLRSVSFAGNEPPTISDYNTFLAGAFGASLVSALPPSLGHVSATSPGEIYDFFEQRKSAKLLEEAHSLIATMLADDAKGLQPLIVASSMKDAATARSNSLMKRAFVHESKKAFIAKIQRDGEVELNVIRGDLGEMGDFGALAGGIVFELFYRMDLHCACNRLRICAASKLDATSDTSLTAPLKARFEPNRSSFDLVKDPHDGARRAV